jgi:hypothetical protein
MKVIDADRFARLPPKTHGAADTGTVILQANLVNADRLPCGTQVRRAPFGAARRRHTRNVVTVPASPSKAGPNGDYVYVDGDGKKVNGSTTSKPHGATASGGGHDGTVPAR